MAQRLAPQEGAFGLGNELAGEELSRAEHERLCRARDVGILTDERGMLHPGLRCPGTVQGDSPSHVQKVLLQSQSDTFARNGWSTDSHELQEKAFDRFAMPYNMQDRGYPGFFSNRAKIQSLTNQELLAAASVGVGSAFNYTGRAYEQSAFEDAHGPIPLPLMAHKDIPSHLLRHAAAPFNAQHERVRQWNIMASSPTARYIRARGDEGVSTLEATGSAFTGQGTATGHSTGLGVSVDGNVGTLQAHSSTFYGK
jgi:hypothetical protein